MSNSHNHEDQRPDISAPIGWDDDSPPAVAGQPDGPSETFFSPVDDLALDDPRSHAAPANSSAPSTGQPAHVVAPDLMAPIDWDEDVLPTPSSPPATFSFTSTEAMPSDVTETPTTVDGGVTPSVVHRRSRNLLAAQVAGLVLLGAVAGTTGYLLGHHGSSPSRSFSFESPFTGPFGASGSIGNFGFGNVPNQNGTTTQPSITAVPSAIKSAESGLVDVNTTVDFGTAAAAGTGIVLKSSGLILTNNHVINGATSISVTDIGNGQTYSAHVVGYDAKDDVAVLQLSGASGLATATISPSAASVGESVYTVGNAGGAGGTPTVTTGKVTALGQSITASDASAGTSEALTGMIGTNSALYSGDSGGAMLTTTGEVVGMDTAAASTVAISTGTQGFAIPIAKALRIATQIETGDTTSRIHIGTTAFLGVEITQSNAGAEVVSVNAGSPALAVGITEGSLITGVNSTKITSAQGLQNAIGKYRPGTKVTVSWTDISQVKHQVTLTLASGPAQ